MAKRTRTKLARTYELDKRGNPLKRLVAMLAPAKMNQVPCLVCRWPLRVNVGQLARVHGECRKRRAGYMPIIKR